MILKKPKINFESYMLYSYDVAIFHNNKIIDTINMVVPYEYVNDCKNPLSSNISKYINIINIYDIVLSEFRRDGRYFYYIQYIKIKNNIEYFRDKNKLMRASKIKTIIEL